MALLKSLPPDTMAYEYETTRALLIRARNGLLLELRREAYDRLPKPTRLLLEIDALLGIEDHQEYVDAKPEFVPWKAPSPFVHTYKGEGLTACGLEVVGPCPDCATANGERT